MAAAGACDGGEAGDALAKMMEAMGPLPEPARRVPLDVRVEEETREDGYIRRKVTFATELGDRCFAWLLLPDGVHPGAGVEAVARSASPRPRPAMLCLHQTTPMGKDEPAGRGGLPNLHYARELAQRGYVTLAPDYPNFGDYRVDPYALGYASATMKGIWNHMRAIDLLAELPQVDPGRIGCIGHSLGGHNTLFLAAFDPRVRVAVSSCGFTRFRWNRNDGWGEPGDVRDWSHAGYMPRIAERYGCRAENMPFDFEDVLAAIAPRPLFINAPLDDAFDVRGVREVVELVRPRYAAAGAADALVCAHPEGGHDFPPEVRAAAYHFLDRWLVDTAG